MSVPTDNELREAIDSIYQRYDRDQNGTLEGDEVFDMINDAFKSLNRGRQITKNEVNNFVVAIDKNGDGRISK